MSLDHLQSKWATYTWIALFSIIPLVYHGSVYEGSHLPKLFFLQIFLCVILLFTFSKPTHLCISSKKWIYGIGLYIALHIASILQAVNPTEAILQSAFQISILAIPLIAITTLSKAQFNQVLCIIPWSGLPIALIGLTQYLGFGFDNIPSNAQPSATFFHRNAAAAFILCVFPLSWIGFQRAQTKYHAVLYSSHLLLFGIFLICTRTRAAWVGLFGAILVTILVSRLFPSKKHPKLKRFKHTLLASLSLCLVLATFLPENIQGNRRVQFDEKKADATTAITSLFTKEGDRGRTDLWIHSLSMLYHHPLGVGLGNWQFQYPYFARGNHINVKAAPERPHNDLLWIATELGILGLGVFIGLICLTFHRVIQLLKTTTPDERIWVQGLMILIGAYLIDGLFSFPRGQIIPSLYFWFAVGGIFLLSQPLEPLTWRIPIWVKGLSLALMAFCTIITFKRIQYDIHHQKVHAAERQANWPTVIQEAEKAHQIGTYRANTFIAQGRALYRTENLLESEKAYKAGLKLHPHSLNAYNNLGIVYRQLGKNEQAVEAFQNALYYHPSFVEAFYNLGNVYVTQQKWEAAQQAYQQALEKGLDIPQLYFKLGQIEYIKGNVTQAKSLFDKALQQDPQFVPAAKALEQLAKTPLQQNP